MHEQTVESSCVASQLFRHSRGIEHGQSLRDFAPSSMGTETGSRGRDLIFVYVRLASGGPDRATPSGGCLSARPERAFVAIRKLIHAPGVRPKDARKIACARPYIEHHWAAIADGYRGEHP